MKRSHAITLTLMAAGGAAALYAYNTSGSGDEADGNYYQTAEACAADGKVSPEDCRKAYDQAQTQNAATAPRFDSQSSCEEQFGAQACYRRDEGGGSFFVPFLTGFLVSNLVNRAIGGSSGYWNSGAGGYYSRPVYRGGTGDLYTGSGSRLSTVGGSTVRAPSADVYQAPPPSRTSVISRGGFGSRSYGSSFGSSSWGS